MFLRLTELLLISRNLLLRSTSTRLVPVGIYVLPTAGCPGVQILVFQEGTSHDDRSGNRHLGQARALLRFRLLKFPIVRQNLALIVSRCGTALLVYSLHPHQSSLLHHGWSGLPCGCSGFLSGCSGFLRGYSEFLRGCSGFPLSSRILLVEPKPNWMLATNRTRVEEVTRT